MSTLVSPSEPTAASAALSCTRVSKTFAGQTVLDSLDLTIGAGRVRALVGENGSGKSTFVKILSGYHRPDPGGEVSIGGTAVRFGSPHEVYAAGARFVHQDLGLLNSLSVVDNLSFNSGYPTRFGTIRGRRARRQAVDALQRVELDIDPDALVLDLLPAQKTGVAVAKALRQDVSEQLHLLVLDEPTAALPEREARSLLAIVRAAARLGVGVLYVSHHLDEVFEVADDVTVLRNGVDVASRPVEGLTRDRLVSYLVGSEFADARREAAAVAARTGDPVLELVDLHGERLRGVSLSIRPGEVVGLAGITGSGRETVCGVAFGARRRTSGEVLIDGTPLGTGRPGQSIKRGLAYLPADRKAEGGFMELSARENLTMSDLKRFWRGGRLRTSLERSEVRRLFAHFDIRPANSAERPMRSLSGGNQQKLLLARLLQRSPRVLLLDEPTHGVDLMAKSRLHHHVLQAARDGAAVVVNSADIDELVALCSRVVILRDGRVASVVSGDRLTVPEVSRRALGAR